MKLTVSIIFLFLTVFGYSQSFEIYISDAGNFEKPPWQILKFDENGQNPTAFIQTDLNWPQDILFLDASNEVLISNLGSGCINSHDANTGAFLANFACSIGGPTRMKIGPDSLLYVLQWGGNGMVRRYKLNGIYLGEFTSVGVTQSIGLDWDDNNNLYVSSYNGKYIRKFDSKGKDLGLFINSNLLGPTNIWFTPNGDLLVADYNGTAVKRFDSNGKYLGDFITGLKNSEGVGFFPNGNILIGNGATNSVKMYNSGGGYLHDIIQSGAGNLKTPNAITIREISSLPIDEIYNDNSNIIISNFRTEFRIKKNYTESITSCIIQNISGQCIKSADVKTQHVIYANNLDDGIYLVVFTFKNGIVKTEKIIVSK